jgi:hypothetical protein
MVGDEVIEVLHGVEAVLQGIGSGLELAGRSAGAGGLESVGSVGSERSFRDGLLARGSSLVRWINGCF